MTAIQKEISARLQKERDITSAAPAKARGLTDTQWTFVVIGLFTVMAIVLNQLGLIV
jgi:hypothetical protein